VTHQEIVSMLGWAAHNERTVRITTADRSEVVGVPSSLDTDPGALEVYLRPAGADDTEIVVTLTAITTVELLA
jgi:hypothetical protein